MSKPQHTFDPEIVSYYNRGKEASRLAEGRNQLEHHRTQILLQRFLPPAPATLHDVGGGAGVYALWLAVNGYEVNLLDALPLHVEQAQEASDLQPASPLASTQVGDARAPPFKDASADAVLLMGPLYHLTERQDRASALREAYRTLKPGGKVIAGEINRCALAIDGLLKGFYAKAELRESMAQSAATGQHRSPYAMGFFTTAFFHHPDELTGELTEAGFDVAALVGIEGIGQLVGDFDMAWADPDARAWILELVQQLETEPTLSGVSGHLMVVGIKP